uniref:Ectonucleoside triphosphate diphosphohydrolase 2 n=1 Tax=Strix occidentalis caurina TaxID=311401 RepID=A0A8D0FZF5_STROC
SLLPFLPRHYPSLLRAAALDSVRAGWSQRAAAPTGLYAIVLDAGPSRTILFIYQWTTTKANKTGVIKECSSCPVQGPGVSNYSDSPQKVVKSLEPCLNWAQKEIPAEQHSQTPLYLGATASMRQLNLTDHILSDSLLAALTVALKSSPFNFQGAQILSSPDEEAFSWVAVNYVLENFFKYDWRGQMVPSGKGMAGVLSVGGTSTRLTYKVEEENQASKEGVRLQLYGQMHSVYTHHCPCHGAHQLRSRLLSISAKTVSNPCWPLTYFREVQWKSVHAGPCAVSDDTSNIPGPEEVFNITGSSNPTSCKRLVQSLLNSSSSCSFFKHSLSSVFKPLQTRFLVGSHLHRGRQLVWRTHDMGPMGDTSSGWTLGYLLSLTNTIPQDSPSFLKGIEPGVWSLLLILFVVLLTEQTREQKLY